MRTPKQIRSIDLALVDDRFVYEAGDESGFQKLLEMARQYVQGLGWVGSVKRIEVGFHVPPVVGVFAVYVIPRFKGIDRWHWVVVGDIPPAYLSLEYSKTPVEALEGYVDEMEAWCEAVESGSAVDDLIPVNVPPTRNWSKALRGRLKRISKDIIEPLKRV